MQYTKGSEKVFLFSLHRSMKFTIAAALCVLFALELPTAHGFPTSLQSQSKYIHSNAFRVLKSSNADVEDAIKEKMKPSRQDITDNLYFPLTFDEMVKQASSTMEAAYAEGITRQVIRIFLPRAAGNDNLLQYYEGEAQDENLETVLVPPDETWQGGIMQLYRACSYSCQEILR
jgi:hypothetical protein